MGGEPLIVKVVVPRIAASVDAAQFVSYKAVADNLKRESVLKDFRGNKYKQFPSFVAFQCVSEEVAD